MIVHKTTDSRLGVRPDPAALAKLADKVAIPSGANAEPGWRHVVPCHEGFDVVEKHAHAASIGCDVSHRQACFRVKYRRFHSRAILCDVSNMNEGQFSRLQANLRRLMKESKVGSKPLAKKIGLGETAIRDILEGRSQNPRIATLSSIANYFSLSVSSLLDGGVVAIVGKIGAGGAVAFEDEADYGGVPYPPDTSGDLIGLEVEGDSMLPKFDSGDVIYISPHQEGVSEELIGSYCACRLAAGGTFLKILARGSKPGTFTLRSLNAGDMEDQELLWATAVRAILPRFARRYS